MIGVARPSREAGASCQRRIMVRHTKKPDVPSKARASPATAIVGKGWSSADPGTGEVRTPLGLTLVVSVGETLVDGLTGTEGFVGGEVDGGGIDLVLTMTWPHIAQFANEVSEPWSLQR
jgi:hypothetical protein